MNKIVKKKGTEYTGLIKSTADLCYWANQPDYKYHCARCGKGIYNKLTKSFNNGVCCSCHDHMQEVATCSVCFKKIHDVGTFNSNTGMSRMVCLACHNRCSTGEGSNTHGYKEGGKLSGGLRDNYYVQNMQDNINRAYEDGGQWI